VKITALISEGSVIGSIFSHLVPIWHCRSHHSFHWLSAMYVLSDLYLFISHLYDKISAFVDILPLIDHS